MLSSDSAAAGRSGSSAPGVRAALGCFAAGFLFLLITHFAFLDLPYHWDELGYFVPAAHDVLVSHVLVPRSTLPNVHPPLVMAYLAGLWKLFGFRIAVTRVAMLAVGAATLAAVFLLTGRLSGSRRAASMAAALLAVSPPFVAQTMLAHLDLPAAFWALLAIYMYLERRWWLCGAAATALALTKETGLIVPAVLIAFSFLESARSTRPVAHARASADPSNGTSPIDNHERAAADAFGLPGAAQLLPLLIPFAVMVAWLVVMRSITGNWLGSAVFSDYNWTFALQLRRIPVVVLRRCYQLGVASFHWIALVLLWLAVTRHRALRGWAWKLVGAMIAVYILFHSALGGAILLRYLLPALALFYVCLGAALDALPPRIRWPGFAVLLAGLTMANWWNPPYPFSYEDNLAVVDFVRLQQQGASWLSSRLPDKTITTAWPLIQALTDPRGGYVSRPLRVNAVENFQPQAWDSVDPAAVEVIALYSRSWDPPGGWQERPELAALLKRYFGYQPQVARQNLIDRFHVHSVARWERRGQWMEIFVR